MNLKVVKGLLKRSHCQLVLCNSGMEAVSRIQEEHFDVLFMDHMMPEMDGIQTLHKMKEEQLLPEDTVPIVLTANAIAGAREEYLAAGFSDYLSKPIIASDLEEMLLKYLPGEKAGRRYQDEEKTVSGKAPDKAAGQMDEKNSQPDENTESTGSMDITESMDTEEATETTVAADKEENQMERLAGLLDTATGLQYCMGSEEFYLEMIQEYLDNDKSSDMSTFFEQENWENYRITVHALKSTSLTIGAADLSEQAKQLEMAAKEEDYGYIRTHHAEVLEAYRKLCGELQPVVGKPSM
jgi:CheY-like chemotaxis protein